METQENRRYHLKIEGKHTIQTPRSQKPGTARKQDTWFYLGFVGDIGFTIALPIVIGAIGGKALDTATGSYPGMTLAGLVFGVLISLVGFIRKIQAIIRLS